MAKVALPKADVDAIRAFAAARIPAEHLDEVRLEVEVRGRSVTIVEFEAPWDSRRRTGLVPPPIRAPSLRRRDEVVVAVQPRQERALVVYDDVDPTPRVTRLLDEIAADPTGIFWG